MGTQNRLTGDALSWGMDFWLLATALALVLAFVYEPINQYAAALIGTPLAVGAAVAVFIYLITRHKSD